MSGTDGRDEIVVVPSSARKVVVIGAASVSGGTLSNGTPICQPDVSPVTNRPVSVTCPPTTASYTVDLGAGDDVLSMDIGFDPMDSGAPPPPGAVTVNGGTGADVLSVTSQVAGAASARSTARTVTTSLPPRCRASTPSRSASTAGPAATRSTTAWRPRVSARRWRPRARPSP